MRSAMLSWLCVLVIVAAAATGAARLPHALRNIDEYRVTHVVVTGTRLLDPQEALDVSGIGSDASIFDDFETWRIALLEHPLILDARIERELPSRVRLHIIETEPLALARTPELRAVDARGLLLPVRAGLTDLDLPVLTTQSTLSNIEGTGAAALRSFSRIDDDASLALLRVLQRMRELDAGMLAAVSEVRPATSGGAVLRMRAPRDVEILLQPEPEPAQLHRARLVLAHLASTGELIAGGAASTGIQLDARFRDQIVVAMTKNTRTAPGSAGTVTR
jgi:hypothetical protein